MRALLPPLDRIPPEIVSLADYEAFSRDRIDQNAWSYLTGGAGDGLTQTRNREAWDAIALLPRVLRKVEGGNTSLDLLGLRLPHPILLAPVAYQTLFHQHGEAATALAAAATDTVMTCSMQSGRTLEDVAAAGEGAPQWFQLYIHRDRGVTRSLVARAEAAGYRAIVLTVDAPLSGIRNVEQRAQFRLPPHVRAANLEEFGKPADAVRGDHPVFDVALAGAPTWDDVALLQGMTRLPVVLKGILSADDARQAASLGVQGIVVSNHGGRTLDTLATTASQLPHIVEAVAGRLAILVDGGIRRGTDVVKARALGADAVMIGRAHVHALAAAGALGVAHAIKLLVEELAVSMALIGARTLDDIGREHLTR